MISTCMTIIWAAWSLNLDMSKTEPTRQNAHFPCIDVLKIAGQAQRECHWLVVTPIVSQVNESS